MKDAVRTPPSSIRHALMREVGFGCPVVGKDGACRSPFLAFHHFDPTWSEGRVHNPDGMIALCAQHHAHADAGAFSKEYLRGLKRSRASTADVRAEYFWSERAFLVRIGGCYATAAPSEPLTVLRLDNVDVISLRRRDRGTLSMDLMVPVPGTDDLITMEDNALTCPVSVIHKLDAGVRGDRFKVWIGEKDVGLAFRFRRMSPGELKDLLMTDWRRANRYSEEGEDREDLELTPSSIQFLLHHATTKLSDGDRRVPVIDFERISVRRSDGSLVVGPQLIEACQFNIAIDCSVAFAINSSGGAAFAF